MTHPPLPTPTLTPTPIVVLGEALIDCIPLSEALTNDAALAGTFKPHLGGSPYNVARAIAKQGGKVWFLNPLSTDCFGQQLAQQHAEEGVRTGLARNSLPTSLAMVSFVEGQPSYQFYREGVADRAFSSEDAFSFLSQFPKPGILHTGSLALIPPESEKTLVIIHAAKKLGWTISVDVNVRIRLARNIEEYLAALIGFIQLTDWLKASDEDLQYIMKADSLLGLIDGEVLSLGQAPAIAQRLQRVGVQKIALTFGEQGAYLQCRDDAVQGAAPKIELADTVGAGDTFWGTCLRLWSENVVHSSQTVLQTAMRAAAINCTFAGCNPPSLAVLDAARK